MTDSIELQVATMTANELRRLRDENHQLRTALRSLGISKYTHEVLGTRVHCRLCLSGGGPVETHAADCLLFGQA